MAKISRICCRGTTSSCSKEARRSALTVRLFCRLRSGGKCSSTTRILLPRSIHTLLGEVAELRRTVDAQRDEIAGRKGGPGRPDINQWHMEKASEPKAPPTGGSEPRQKASKTSKFTIHEERTVKLKPPANATMASSISCGTRFFRTGFLRLISCRSQLAAFRQRQDLVLASASNESGAV
jgi:hypothetical protein